MNTTPLSKKNSLLMLATLYIALCTACSGASDDDDMSEAVVDMSPMTDMTGGDQGEGSLDSAPDATGDVDMGTRPDASPGVDMPDDAPLEVIGVWASIYGEEEITSSVWGFYEQVEHDNEENVALTRNADDGSAFALKYNRLVWTDFAADGSFYYCTTDFGLDTLEEARSATTAADASMPDVTGCGNFAWTQLVPNEVIEIQGAYMSNFATMELVSTEAWDFGYLVASMISFNNAANVAITQNPASDDPNTFPNTFSRIVWTEPDASGSFYYCTTDYGKATAEEAAMMPTMANDLDPESSGCGGFPWTKLTVTP